MINIVAKLCKTVLILLILWYNISSKTNKKSGDIMSIFTLLNKNKKIFDFEYDYEEHLIVKIDRNYPDNEEYAPFGLIKDNTVDKNKFNRWWKNRQIPASRNGLREVLYKSDIYDKDNFDLLDAKAYCLSLSDQYWVKRIDGKI